MKTKGIQRKFFQLLTHIHKCLLDVAMNKAYFHVCPAGNVRSALQKGLGLDFLFALENPNCNICIPGPPCQVLMLR